MSFQTQIRKAFSASDRHAEHFWDKKTQVNSGVTNDGILSAVEDIKSILDAIEGLKKKKEPDCPDIDWTEDCGQGRIRNCHSGEDTDCQVECGPCFDPTEESIGLSGS